MAACKCAGDIIHERNARLSPGATKRNGIPEIGDSNPMVMSPSSSSRYGSVLMLLFMGHAVPSQVEPAPSKLAAVTQPRVKVCVEFQIKQKTKNLSRRHVLPRTLYPRTRPRSRQQYPPRASNIYKRSPLPGR